MVYTFTSVGEQAVKMFTRTSLRVQFRIWEADNVAFLK